MLLKLMPSPPVHVVIRPGEPEAADVTLRSLAHQTWPVRVWTDELDARRTLSPEDPVLVLDAGDVAPPDLLGNLLRCASSQPTGTRIVPRVQAIDADGLLLPRPHRRLAEVSLCIGPASRGRASLCTNALLYRRDSPPRPEPSCRPRRFANPRFTTAPKAAKPSVAVLIPARNMEGYIAATLDSVARQTLPADEVVVVEDGSSDATGEIARAHPIVTHVIPGPRRGLAAARNAGLSRIRSDWVVFLDADDLIEPDWIARVSGVARRRPDTEVIIGLRTVIDDDGTRLLSARERVTAWSPRALACRNGFGGIAGAAVRRTTLLAAGGFREDILFAEDLDLWHRLSANAMLIAVDAPGARIRHRRGSMLRDGAHEEQLRWMRDRVRDASPDDRPQAEAMALLDTARRAFVGGDLEFVRAAVTDALRIAPRASLRSLPLLAAACLPTLVNRRVLEARRQLRRAGGRVFDAAQPPPFGTL